MLMTEAAPGSRQIGPCRERVKPHVSFAVIHSRRPTRPFDPCRCTTDENKSAVHGCNPHWGRYSVADGAIVFKIEHAMFPNWEGVEQKRPFSISGDELTYKVPAASAGGTSELVWKRAK